MSNVVRRTLEELLARYEFEPELRDIYVEGEFDSDMLTASLGDELNEHYIYSIETVDIPAEVLQVYSLTSGNKQRIIALAKELESKIEGEFNYLCLTDRDLDHWFGEMEVIRNHKWTTYSSLEMHFFTEEFLRHHLRTVSRAKIESFDNFFGSFTEVLRKVFSLRCVDRELGLNLRWIPIEKCVFKKNGSLDFNFEEYISRTLHKSGMFYRLDNVKDGFEKWNSNLSGDPRQFIRGHDFVQLLSWVIKNFGGIKDISTEVAVYRLFVGAALSNQDIYSEIAA